MSRIAPISASVRLKRDGWSINAAHSNYSKTELSLTRESCFAHECMVCMYAPGVKGLVILDTMLFSVARNLATLDFVSALLSSSISSCSKGNCNLQIKHSTCTSLVPRPHPQLHVVTKVWSGDKRAILWLC